MACELSACGVWLGCGGRSHNLDGGPLFTSRRTCTTYYDDPSLLLKKMTGSSVGRARVTALCPSPLLTPPLPALQPTTSSSVSLQDQNIRLPLRCDSLGGFIILFQQSQRANANRYVSVRRDNSVHTLAACTESTHWSVFLFITGSVRLWSTHGMLFYFCRLYNMF